MKVYLIKTDSPVITYSTWVNAGGVDELTALGVAHFIEHMAFKDNKHYTAKKIADTLYLTGGNYNALTNYDYTIYYATVPAYELNNIIKIDASRYAGLVFNQNQFEQEKKVIIQERGLRLDNSPTGRFSEQINHYIFNNNYGRSLIGSESGLSKIKISDLKSFYKKYYRPENIKVFVIGNIKPNALKTLVHKYYSHLLNSRKHILKSYDYGLTQYRNKVFISIKDPKVVHNLYIVSWLAPSFTTSGHNINKIMALKVLSNYLSSQDGELYKRLVKSKHLATYMGSNYDSMAKLNTNLGLYILPSHNNPNNFKKTMQEVTIVLDDLKKRGIPKKKLLSIINEIQYQQIYLKDNQKAFLMNYANFIMNGYTNKQFLNYKSRLLNNLKPRVINNYIKSFLTHNSMILYLQKAKVQP